MHVNKRRMFLLPFVAEYWESARDEFSADFVAELESIVAEWE